MQDYWQESARPLTGLAFVAPLLCGYELGVAWLGQEAVRNGADIWMRALLDSAGLGRLLLPLLACGVLLAWHHVRREDWSLRPTVLSCMHAESAVLGFVLLIAASLHGAWFPRLDLSEPGRNAAAQVVAYLGAGVYEELLFRLLLLPVAIVALRRVGAGPTLSVLWAVIFTSLLFSAAHYRWTLTLGDSTWVVGSGEAWQAWSFWFRGIAGVFFSVIFLKRGFGIAVGAHAAYDLMVLAR